MDQQTKPVCDTCNTPLDNDVCTTCAGSVMEEVTPSELTPIPETEVQPTEPSE